MFGLFDDVEDIDSAEGFRVVPSGTHRGVVSDVAPGEDEYGRHVVITYTFTTADGEEYPFNERLNVPEGKREEWDNETIVTKKYTQAQINEFALSRLKTRLDSLGVPKERFNSTGPEHLIGTEVVASLAEDKNGYMKIKRLALDTGQAVSSYRGYVAPRRPEQPPKEGNSVSPPVAANPFKK